MPSSYRQRQLQDMFMVSKVPCQVLKNHLNVDTYTLSDKADILRFYLNRYINNKLHKRSHNFSAKEAAQLTLFQTINRIKALCCSYQPYCD